MISLEAALDKILGLVRPLEMETVTLEVAAGRILRGDLTASVDLPPFDNSAMDGYAVRAADTTGATPASPAVLRLTGAVPAGAAGGATVEAGACARIYTGSPVSPGADAVVMQEDTMVPADDAGLIHVRDSVKPFENLRLRGEDVRRGEVLARSGVRLNAARLALLAACGQASVPVGRVPRVAILSTGNELRRPGETLALGQIYESNSVMLHALSGPVGVTASVLQPVEDSLDAVSETLRRGLEEHDVIITSGGVSVGDYDYVKAAASRLGGRLDLWRVAIKPGKPFALATFGEKILFGLPGNPVSAFVTFLLLVRPVLLRMQGAADLNLPSHPGILRQPLRNPGDRRHFVRVHAGPDGEVRLAGPQASHRLASLAEANGLLDMPPQAEFEAGRKVSVLRWDAVY